MAEVKLITNNPKPEPQQEKPIIKPVAQATIKKRSAASKVFDALIAEDLSTIKQHVVKDVIIPRIRQMATDIITSSANMLFGTKSTPTASTFGSTRISYTSGINYSGFSSTKPQVRSEVPSFDEILLDTREDAEDVIRTMRDILDRYKTVSINVLYELVGLPGEASYENYGWNDLRYADVIPYGGKYLIRMPRPIVLK